MNSMTTRFAALMGSASLLALANALTANAQQFVPVVQVTKQQVAQVQLAQNDASPSPAAQVTPEVIPEQVLVTGSLIRGAAPVGAPVLSLGQQDYLATGSITIGDILKNVPGVVLEEKEEAAKTGNPDRISGSVNLHLLAGYRSLLMVNGMRYPLQARDASEVTPNILPQLAIDHIDILLDGASATYGSDAIAGVINVIMKRGFDGAETLLRVGTAASGYGGGNLSWQAAQLYGRTWDGGDITVSYQNSGATALTTTADRLKYQFTNDFTPWGLNNITPIASAYPGIVSTGKPSATSGTACTNCFSVPTGQNGVGLTWAQLLANPGVLNQHNPYATAELSLPYQNNAATITFDQSIFPGISLFVDGFYQNRRFVIRRYPSNVSQGANQERTFTVPTTNPYYPIGAPAGLQVSYNFMFEDEQRLTGGEVGKRLDAGFNIDLPFQWQARLFSSYSENTPHGLQTNIINDTLASAALGNTIAAVPQSGSTPPSASFTKPANIPYLNVFCDPTAFTCNSPDTLNYLAAHRLISSNNSVRESGGNFDGPLFDLPGGTVKAAVGGEITAFNFSILQEQNYGTTGFVNQSRSSLSRNVVSGYVQVNVPVFGGDFQLPLVERLNLEGSFRYDDYSDFGGVNSPKASFDWTLGAGFTVKGSWGQSFRAPFAQELLPANASVGPANILAGASANSQAACDTVGGTPVPGSAAAILNPTCSAALQFQGGITANNAPIAGLRPGDGLPLVPQPERSLNTSFGFEFAPDYSFLKGFDLQMTYWNVNVSGYLTLTGIGQYLNDPNQAATIVTKADPNFDKYVALLLQNVSSTVPPGNAGNISWIVDEAFINSGYKKVRGIDYHASYDYDFGAYGAINLSDIGTYYLRDRDQIGPGGSVTDYLSAGGNTTIPILTNRLGLGWTDGSYSVSAFWNHTGHYFTTQALPPAQYLAKFPNYSNIEPAFDTFDLAFGYNTGENPANVYLKNIGITLSINDVFDAVSPFAYVTQTQGATPAAFDATPSETYVGRFISIAIDKKW